MKEAGIRLAKEKKAKKSSPPPPPCKKKAKKSSPPPRPCKDNDDDRSRPYIVSFPGRYPYPLRHLKDPRLGVAQKNKERFYEIHGLDDDDDDDDGRSPSSEDEIEVIRTEDDKRTGPINHNPTPAEIERVLLLDRKSSPQLIKRSRQRWRNRFRFAVENEAEILKKRDCLCAETAIKFYNEKHGTDYEIVETLGSYKRVYVGFWFHCNFRAQSKSDGSSSPKLFFAELQRLRLPDIIVKKCVPLDDPVHPSARIVRGCKMCGNQLFHPVDGFEAAKFKSFTFSCRTPRQGREKPLCFI